MGVGLGRRRGRLVRWAGPTAAAKTHTGDHRVLRVVLGRQRGALILRSHCTAKDWGGHRPTDSVSVSDTTWAERIRRSIARQASAPQVFKKRISNGQKCNLITGILFLVNAFMIEKRYCAAFKLGLFMFPQMHFSFELRSYQITHHFEGVFWPSIFFMNPKKATPNSSSK